MTGATVERVPLSRLKPAPWNPRTIRDTRFKALCASLKADPAFLERRPVLAMADGTIYAGNMRYRAAASLGWTEIPAVVEDVDERTAKERALRDNNQSGEWQEDDLARLVYELGQDGADLHALAFDEQDLGRLLASVGVGGGEEAPEAEVDRAEELRGKWGTASGQLWEIGRHRLLCGDATSESDLRRVLGAEAPGIVFADPPYGISIVAATGYVGGGEAYDIPFGGRKGHVGGPAAHMERTGMTYMEAAKRKRFGSVGGAKPFGDEPVRGAIGATNVVAVGKYLPVKGDETNETATTAYRLCAELWPGAVHVWWGANHYSDVFPASPCWVVWNKENTGNFADCELAWTNRPTAVRMFTHRWNGMVRDSERERRWHPTQKPAALAAWCFEQYAAEGCVVLDPFAGAGWSLVAAEQTGRRGYGVEYEADYIAVMLERLSKMGLTPRRVED